MTPPRTILAATDFSPPGDYAVQEVCRWAAEIGAKVHLLHVQVPPIVPASVDLTVFEDGRVRHAALDGFDRMLQPSRPAVRIGERSVMMGNPRTVIVETARALAVDLIALGTHGRRGLQRLALGSVAESVVSDAERPVLVVRPPRPAVSTPQKEDQTAGAIPRTVLVPIDLMPRSLAALRYAMEVAQALGARVHVLHVYAPLLAPSAVIADQTPYDAQHRDVLAQLEEATASYVTTGALGKCIAASGDPRFLIETTAQELRAELIVLGSNNKSALNRALLGSVAHSIVRAAPCSVLVAK